MSLKIIKAGILDTVQDLGRYGYQHLGINPSGAMDRFAAQAVNFLVGNDKGDAVIELHFPASVFLFEQDVLISLGGADFTATVNGEEIPLWQPVIVSKNSLLQFQKWKRGARCYLAVRENLKISKWVNSFSTNLKACAGGFRGRALQKKDEIFFMQKGGYKKILKDKDYFILPWKADVEWSKENGQTINMLLGNEWSWLSDESKENFFKQGFKITSIADRMGYKLNASLSCNRNEELVSSAVTYGTIQLLPDGDLIVLMADHQTTGGYPRIGHVISAHLPFLSQSKTGDEIYFMPCSRKEAENLFIKQQQHLLQLQNACKFRLQDFLNAYN